MINSVLVIGGKSRHMHRWMSYVSSALPKDIYLDILCIDGRVQFSGARHSFYPEPINRVTEIMRRIPKVRAIVMIWEIKRTAYKLIENGNYSAIIIQQPTPFMGEIVRKARGSNLKVVLTPWGSDLLRISSFSQKLMTRLFERAHYVTSNAPSFYLKFQEMFKVDSSKLVNVGFGSEILDDISRLKGVYSKDELANQLSIPSFDYYIACGYNGDSAQRHLLMIDSIAKNKQLLSPRTLLLFQFTYGDSTGGVYKQDIIRECEKHQLQYFFITDYISNEKMAMFRLLIDLFIHIQPTDAANASLQEYLLADTLCINGRWLQYPQLEEFGYPYIICNSPDELPYVLKRVFNGELDKPDISERTLDRIARHSWNVQKNSWAEFIIRLCMA